MVPEQQNHNALLFKLLYVPWDPRIFTLPSWPGLGLKEKVRRVFILNRKISCNNHSTSLIHDLNLGRSLVIDFLVVRLVHSLGNIDLF